MPNEQQRLYNSYLNGDNRILEEVFQDQHKLLLSIAYGYTKNQDDAIDVVSDIYHKLLKSNSLTRENLYPDVYEDFLKYIRTMVNNKCKDLLKQKENRKHLLKNNYFNSRVQYTLPDSAFIEPEFQKTINKLLNPKEVQILQLHIDGYKNKEIAKDLELSPFTVRNSLSTSKKKLRKEYKRHY